MFKVGQKVVCIDDDWNHLSYMPTQNMPNKGEIYTVREIEIFGNDVGIRLCEVVNKPWRSPDGLLMEQAFDIDAFRPIDYTFGEQVCESLEVMTEPELV